jgi:hypothetical protein
MIIISLPFFAGLIQSSFEDSLKRNAADHLRVVTKAAADYTRKHQAALLSGTGPAGGPTIYVVDLVTDGLLPYGFSSANVWGQSYEVHFRQPEPNALQTVVLTTGGYDQSSNPKFANLLIPHTALLAGGAAGFVPSGIVPGEAAGTLQGSGGGWVINLGSLGIASPGAGHLGSVATFDSSALGQDFLYRVAVPGRPELNSMFTELDMRDHAIRNVAEVQFQARAFANEACAPEDQGKMFLDREQGLYLCRNEVLEVVSDTGNSVPLKQAAVVRNGEMIDKPLCAPGTDTVPQIFTAPAIAEAGPDSPPVTAVQTWAESADDTQWQVFLRVQTSDTSFGDGDGWVYPTDDYGRIMTFAVCARETPPGP